MQVLIETRMNSLKLNEDKSKTPKKGCLGRLEGICADFKNPTRNGRLYPLELWKKVFDDSLFKEALENKTLFGELDHPEDRFEPLVKHACIVMTDYEIDEDKGVIYGGFDILDTPDGRVLRSILDYGSVLGVSSRGQGDIIETVEGERVDENSYDFACFDVVSTPAVEKARQKVMEGLKREKKESFKESLTKQIADAETITDLNIIRSVVRTSDLTSSDMDTILESIEDKCKSLQVGETITTEHESATQPLTESTESCNNSAKTIRDNKKLYKCIKGLREQVSAYKHREKRYIETINSKEEELSERDTQISKLKESLNASKMSINVLKESNSNNKDTVARKDRQLSNKDRELSNKDRQIHMMRESLRNERQQSTKEVSQRDLQLRTVTEQYDRKLNNCNEKLSENMRTIASLKEKNTSLLEDLKDVRSDRDRITKELNSQKSQLHKLQERIEEYENQISCLEKEMESNSREHDSEISSIDREVEEYSQLLSEAQQKISNGNDTITSLRESLKETENSLATERNSCSKLNESLKMYQKSYTDKIANMSGIDPKSIYHSITTETTPEQINKIVESYRRKLDRYNKLGISDNGISGNNYIVESLNNSYDSYEAEEQTKLISFLEAATKSI